jgi:hypothetical protein
LSRLARPLRATAAPRAQIRLLAAGRAGFGLLLMARPRTLTTPAGIDELTGARLSWVVRMLGAREVGIGVGAFGRPRALGWMLAGLFSDATDAVSIAAAVRSRRVGPVWGVSVVGIALAAVAVQARGLRGRADAPDHD